MSHICDCGQIYASEAALRECQAREHAGSAEAELADAEADAALWDDYEDAGPEDLEDILEWALDAAFPRVPTR